MAEIKSGLHYTKSHEWVKVDGDTVTMGVTDFAQSELGDITYLELPEAGDSVSKSEPLGVIESVKAASDIYSPVSGEIVEANDQAIDAPESVNSSPYDDAWLVKIKLSDSSELDELMDSATYEKFVEEEGGH
ncbi:MAG: glycine cleavage system protein GcvH [Sphaerobacteraceae bacterium]|nr:MAG: glycine cleavage system protein GcvH [Sphaerobacteraceae bacterium]